MTMCVSRLNWSVDVHAFSQFHNLHHSWAPSIWQSVCISIHYYYPIIFINDTENPSLPRGIINYVTNDNVCQQVKLECRCACIFSVSQFASFLGSLSQCTSTPPSPVRFFCFASATNDLHCSLSFFCLIMCDDEIVKFSVD